MFWNNSPDARLTFAVKFKPDKKTALLYMNEEDDE